MIKTEPLTSTVGDTYAVLVHRNHARRVLSAMEAGQSPDATDWITLHTTTNSSDGSNAPSPGGSLPTDDGVGDCISTHQTTVIPTPYMKGRRKSRRGYALLIIRNARCSPVELPAIARSQMSWAAKLTHCTSAANNGDADVAEGCDHVNLMANEIAKLAFQNLQQQNFTFEETPTKRADELRLDIRPKSLILGICSELQRIAFKEAGIPLREDTDPNDPYDGPIRMTRSVTKCSHVLNIVFNSLDEEGENNEVARTPTCGYWGLSPANHQSAIINKINNYAHAWIEPSDSAIADIAAPTSRAYYKLHQAFNEHLQQYAPAIVSAGGAGLDLGASPGGWTQVLHQRGIRPVVAIDQGLLAPRVRDLDGVIHVRGDFSSEESSKAIAQCAPYSAIVCDANIFLDLFDYVAKTLEAVSKKLLSENNDGGEGGESSSAVLTLPSVCIFTIKMPYKTKESLKRNFIWAMSQIETCLKRIAALLKNGSNDDDDTSGINSDICVKYKVVHLHANSESERTLIAVFDEQKRHIN